MSKDADLIKRLMERVAEYEELARGYTRKAEALKVAIEELGGMTGPALAPGVLPVPKPDSAQGEPSLEGMTISDAVYHVLSGARRPLHTNEILDRLEKAGKRLSINGLRGVLYGRDNRGRFDKVGKSVWWPADRPKPGVAKLHADFLRDEPAPGDADA